MTSRDIVDDFKDFIDTNKINHGHSDLILSRCFSEAWFSDTLAWLLNPKGSHKLGVSFLSEFVKVIAQERSKETEAYRHKKSFLKWGKAGVGTLATHFSLKNTSVVREFFLTRSVDSKVNRGPRYCDLVILDQDVSDGLFIVVENKLFTSNHPFQLQEYNTIVEDKFSRSKVREYVYLTLTGRTPISYEGESTDIQKIWVRLSWIGHVNEVLKKVSHDKSCAEIDRFIELLDWLAALERQFPENMVNLLGNRLLASTAECLHEELVRLGEGTRGNWILENENGGHPVLRHSSFPKKPLHIEMLPNFTIAIQARTRKKRLFDKIIMPFGANSDQIFNLIDIAARDIYHAMDKADQYLSSKRRLTTTISPKKQEHRSTFRFISKYQYALRIIMQFTKYVWDAYKYEQDTYLLEEEDSSQAT